MCMCAQVQYFGNDAVQYYLMMINDLVFGVCL